MSHSLFELKSQEESGRQTDCQTVGYVKRFIRYFRIAGKSKRSLLSKLRSPLLIYFSQSR